MTTIEPVLFSVERELESWADSVARLPAQVRKAIEDGQGELAARLLVAGGERRVNWLTNVVFHTRHKRLRGREIRPGETDLAGKWLEIRRDVVLPMLRAPVPVPPAPPVASQTFPLAPTPTRPMAEWRQQALKVAGIDPAKWQPVKKFKHNRPIVERVYAYYMGLFNRNENLLWAGMAKLAGGTVFRALLDIHFQIEAKIGAGNPTVFGGFEIGSLAVMEMRLIEAQQAIFEDLAWQHQAFVEKGLKELEAFQGVPISAWRDIASNDSARVWHGNKALLRREQEVILAPFYQAVRDMTDMDMIPKQMSERAESPIPDGKPFRVVVPGGDITLLADRWKWIETDMLPAYQRLTPERRRKLVNHPLTELANRRWPS